MQYRTHHHRLHRPQQRFDDSLYQRAMIELDEVLYDLYGHDWRHVRVERLSTAIDEMKQRTAQSESHRRSAQLIALLLLQTPRAARAQDAMDRRHGGSYHHRQKRLYELIDFNDTFVDIVLSLRHEQRAEFHHKIYALMHDFCVRARTHVFSPEQFDAITHGLSRETAVYLGAQKEGFDVHMTNRVADGLGVDMQIRDRDSGRYINIDCKTTKAYLRRVEELRREERLDEREVGVALTRGYIRVSNGRNDEQVEVVLFSVVSELFGGIQDFEFATSDVLALKLREAINVYGRQGDGFYQYKEE
ncbi:hypothetical protein I8H89_04975 [Candidatus Saccharibacteria bacterium]|nr:hypothetical protein [Candidatus Saccharibacteria bacterium]